MVEFLHNVQTLFLILHPEGSTHIILMWSEKLNDWSLKCIFLNYSNSVPTWQRPHCISITNKILLIWRSEIIDVCCENFRKFINTICRQAKVKLKDKSDLYVKVSRIYIRNIYTPLCIVGLTTAMFLTQSFPLLEFLQRG